MAVNLGLEIGEVGAIGLVEGESFVREANLLLQMRGLSVGFVVLALVVRLKERVSDGIDTVRLD